MTWVTPISSCPRITFFTTAFIILHIALIKLLLLPLTIILKQGYCNYSYNFKQGYTHMLGRAWVLASAELGRAWVLQKIFFVGLG